MSAGRRPLRSLGLRSFPQWLVPFLEGGAFADRCRGFPDLADGKTPTYLGQPSLFSLLLQTESELRVEAMRDALLHGRPEDIPGGEQFRSKKLNSKN
jgi:hypothetical protein